MRDLQSDTDGDDDADETVNEIGILTATLTSALKASEHGWDHFRVFCFLMLESRAWPPVAWNLLTLTGARMEGPILGAASFCLYHQ